MQVLPPAAPNIDIDAVHISACPVVLVVLGDRAARRGISLFEQQMTQRAFVPVAMSCGRELSTYIYIRAGCRHNAP